MLQVFLYKPHIYIFDVVQNVPLCKPHIDNSDALLQLSHSKYLLILTCDIHSLHALSPPFFTYVDICDVRPLHSPSPLLLNVH